VAGTIIVNNAQTDASNVFTIKTATGDNMLQIGTGGLASSSITTAMLQDNSVTAAKIAPGTIVDSDIADNAVTTAKIAATAVTPAKLATNAVTTGKIANDAVTTDKTNLISTSSVPSLEAKGTSGSTSGYIQLNCSENSHGIKLLGPPHSAAANYTLTLPNNDGDASQFLQTNGSGVTSWATVSSTPTNVKVSKAVTGGSVVATRAVSMAADGSVGVYPTINTLGTRINQSIANSQVALGKGRTQLRTVVSVVSTSVNRASCYGSYLNGSGVWVENATPLVIDCQMNSAFSEQAAVQHLAPAAPGTDGDYVIMQTSRSPTNQISAVQVNVSTGAPTLKGSSLRRSTSPGGGNDGGSFRKGMNWFGFWENNVTYPYYYYDYSAGMQLISANLSSTLRGLFNVAGGDADILMRGNSVQAGGRVYWHVGNIIYNMAMSSNLMSGARTAVTIATDYQSEEYVGFLDGSHLLTYYRDTSGVKKFRTYSFNATSVTLIDTHVAPSDFANIPYWAMKDTKNIFVGNGTVNTNNFSSIGLASDWTINGTNVKIAIFNTAGDIKPRWTGSGDVFTLHLLDGVGHFRQPFTVASYATTQFVYGGIASAGASSGTTPIIVGGVAGGYSGLTTGINYHVASTYDGLLSTSTTLSKVGRAISATQISLGEI